MKVIVIGVGEVGRYVASVLAGEKHDVTVVDTNASQLARAEEKIDVMALNGNGASLKTLNEAQVGSADLVAAITGSDVVNLLAAQFAKQLGAGRTIARVSTRDYLDDSERGYYHNLFGIDLVVSTQILVANEIYKLIKSFGAVAVENFADNRIEVVQIPIGDDARVVGKPLRDVTLPPNTLVTAILRRGEVMIPGGADAVHAGDEVFLMGAVENMGAMERLFGSSRRQTAQNVFIIGGGKVGASVAHLLERDKLKVRLIEHDEAQCLELASTLNNTIIINGDGTDASLLKEENVGNADVFVAASDNDEVNLMSSLLAKRMGAKKTIAVVSRADYVSTYELLGIDATVSPRQFAAGQILKYARQGEVISVSLLVNGAVEVLEVIPDDESEVVGKPLMDINFPRGAVVAAIASEDGVVVPNGQDVIRPGNHVVVFTLPEVRADLDRLFRKRLFSLSGLLGGNGKGKGKAG